MSIRMHWRYARYVWRHKVFVFRACRRLGVPWLGVLHDLSKLRPDEWNPYVAHFYGGPHRPWTHTSGYEKTYFPRLAWASSAEGVQEAFDLAWLAHIHRNRHHPQYWVLRQDTDGVACLPMPERYIREMVADWLGAGMAIKGHGWDRAPAECRAWWAANKARSGYALHPATRRRVEQLLEGLG